MPIMRRRFSGRSRRAGFPSNALTVAHVSDNLATQLGRPPTVKEIARILARSENHVKRHLAEIQAFYRRKS